MRLRAAARQSAAIIEHGLGLVCTHDQQGVLLSVNRAAAQALGRSKRELVGRNLRELLATSARPLFDQYLCVLRERGAAVGKMRISTRTGAERIWKYECVVHKRPGQPACVIGFAADATRETQVHQELRAQRELLESLVAVARATTARPGLQETLQSALELARSLAGAEGAALFLVDETGQPWDSVFARGDGLGVVRYPQQAARVMRAGVAGWVAQHRQSVVIADAEQDPRWLRLPTEPRSTRSVLCVPIQADATLVGVLTLVHSDAERFAARQLRLVEAAAELMALALRNAQLFEETRRMAARQGLLYEILRTAGAELAFDVVGRGVVDAIATRTAWPSVFLHVPGEDPRLWRTTASGGGPERDGPPPSEGGIIGRAQRSAQVQLVADAVLDTGNDAAATIARSELAVPVKRGQQVLGVLDIQSPRPGAFGPDDVRLAESVCEAVALALENARLYRRLTEEGERLQALIKSSHDGILMVGANQRLLVVNAPALRLLGMAGGAEAWLERTTSDWIAALEADAPAAAAVARSEMRRVAEGDPAPGRGEFTAGPLAVEWQNLPVFAQERVLGRLFVLRDVSAERAVENARQDLTRALVHDMRSPLTAMIGALDIVGESAGLSVADRRALAIGEDAAGRLLGFVNSILDVSRLESGALPIRREDTDLARLVAEALEQARPLAARKGLELVAEVDPRLGPACVDADLVFRVFQNLLDNAIKFSERGVVRVRAALGSDQTATFSVQDGGPGIPAELAGRLFQKFAAGSAKGSGTGLGLAFCRLAIEAHGGRIWVEPREPHGSTFSFTLPGARRAADPPATNAPGDS